TAALGTAADDAADAVAASLGPPGGVATLLLPADVSWSDSPGPVAARPRPARPAAAPDAVEAAARALRSGEPTALLLGGGALRARGLRAAARAAEASGARLLGETFPANLERGAGLPVVERLAYLAELAVAQLIGLRHLVVVGARPPVSFFAYPDRPSDLVPDGCAVHVLADVGDDVPAALDALADVVGADALRAGASPPLAVPSSRPDRPAGALDAESLAAAIGAVLPDGAIVVDEANTGGLYVPGATAGCPRHDWLTLTGGAIGQGLPVATGAAVAAPDRPVLCLEADGSAMYTVQALWTQAREGLNVTTVVLANRSYAILNLELSRVGAGAGGPLAGRLLDLSRPDLDFVALATGLGVPAVRAATADELVTQLERSLAEPGPSLVEVVLPRLDL
ncbi:MAG TPA: acetolactate synthase large subunit, partial [Acidimicrobiales bacterium]|nr:acetolactate synthase large subunit [Acidimicrobiales bacterium]